MQTVKNGTGAKIIDLRDRLGINQGDLAQRLRDAGLPWSQGTLSKVETGLREVRLHEAVYLSRVLNVPLDVLAGADVDHETETARRVFELERENAGLKRKISAIRDLLG